MFESGELRYEGVSFLFGRGTPYRVTGFQRGTAEWRTDDAARPRMDGVGFGRDFKGAASHTLSLAVVDGTDPIVARGLVGELESVWNAASLRSAPGALAELQVGPDRFCVGRPRELAPDDSGLWDGVGQAALTFVAANDLWYGPTVQVTQGLVPEFTGGLPVPAEVPFVLGGGTGVSDTIVTVGGTHPSFPVFELEGPIVDPFIDVPGVGRLVFKGELLYDQVLQVDTRPWARWVKRNGAAFPGALSPAGSRLADMRMPPGAYQIIFGGYDPSGTSRLTTRVEPAFASF